MTEKDKRDVLKDIQTFIHNNANNSDVNALIQAMEKVIRGNCVLDRDAIEVLDFVTRYKGGICVDGQCGAYEPKCEMEMSIYDRGSKCFALVSDAVHKLKKKYAYKMQPQPDSMPPSCDAVFKRDVIEPQPQRTRLFVDCVLVENKTECVAKLHELIDNRIGRAVAMVIRAAIETGLILKPTSTQVKEEFKGIGNVRGYNKYMGTDFSCDDDYLNIKNILGHLNK
jgi:hypothetical protein